MAEATPGWVPVAVHVLTRLLSITWVAAMMAMRWPSMVTRYGVKACAALFPMPMIGYASCVAMVRFCDNPSRAAVEAVVVGLGDEGDPGALQGGDGRCGRIEDVLLVLRLGAGAVGHHALEVHHAQLVPAKSWGMVVPRAVEGSEARLCPTVPCEMDVAAEAQGHRVPVAGPVRVQRRVLGEVRVRTVSWAEWDVVDVVDAGGLPEPPEKAAR